MKITYYGHSSFGIEINEGILLVDPFISGNTLVKAITLDAGKDLMLLAIGESITI